MSTFTRTWSEGNRIDPTDEYIPVRQVYVWTLTIDGRVILVSKDGDNWQLPGGKPEVGESLVETAKREVHEEAGVDISSYEDSLEFFGYYTINEPAANPATYHQVRYLVHLPISSVTLGLNADREDTHQTNEDIVHFADAVDLHEVAGRIPWMLATEEYRYLVDSHIINE